MAPTEGRVARPERHPHFIPAWASTWSTSPDQHGPHQNVQWMIQTKRSTM